MIEFSYIWAFVCLPLPLLVMWFAPSYKARKASLKVPYFVRLVDVTGEVPKKGAVILRRNIIQRLFLVIAWVCLVTALAKPQLIGPPIKHEESARDLMIAVDLSGSMSVEDFRTENGDVVDRLVAVKTVLAEFAKGRQGDRLGLILFGDSPYLQAPFTADILVWLNLLDEATIGMAGQSTAFGDAIGLSIKAFEQSKTSNRVLIVLTDGNDTSSRVPPAEAAKVAAAHDIKIYTIAVGDPDAVGEEKVDLKVLQTIAEVSGGKAFEALNREELAEVYNTIDSLEPQTYESLVYRSKTSVHQYPMMVFTIMYLIAFMIVGFRSRRTRGEASHG